MARSVKWPFKRTARGGLALTSDSDQGQEELRQTIVLAHLPGPSGSAWGQRDGVGAPEIVFGSEAGVANGIVHSRRVFARLERAGRARLRPGFPRVVPSGETRAAIDVEFEDLESGQPGRVTAR